MLIKVNNYCKGSFKNQIEKAFTEVESSNNNHIYKLKKEYEYRGKFNGRQCFSRKEVRKELNEVQILCTILKED